MNNHLLDLIKVAVGSRREMILPPSADEWQYLLNECIRHSIVGIGWEAIEKLPAMQKPDRRIMGQWYLLVQEIEHKAHFAEKAAEKVERMFRQDGMKCCILKGQGVARLYPVPYHRQSGDIDLWVDWDIKKCVKYVRQKLNTRKVEARIHHVEFPMYKNATIEIHYLPMFMYSFSSHRRLKNYFNRERATQLDNEAFPRPDVEGMCHFHTPTPEFNVVFMLTHILRHLLEEGIGLRQLIDYYYVLKALPRNADDSGVDEAVKQRIMSEIRRLDLECFLASMMYVMREAMGMEEKYLICKDDSTDGHILLSEIMYTGNFGFYDTRDLAWKRASVIGLFFGKFAHNMRLWQLSPQEILSGPMFRLWHQMWRSFNHYTG